MGVEILGPVQVERGAAQLGSRDRTVLAALAACRGEAVSPDQLADAVWGDQPPPSWGKNLQGCVSRLRKHLGPDAIQTVPQGYRLALPVDAVDAWQFEGLMTRAQELLTLGEPERARFTATRALELWRGPALSELEEWERGSREAARLHERRLEAEEVQLEAALAAGHHREVLGQAQSMVRAAPLRERRWSLLALAQYRSGRQAEALRTLHQLRRMLGEELGLDPAPDVVALEHAILRQDPALAVADATPAEERCPYLGLRPFEEGDAESYFGRDVEVLEALERLDQDGVLAAVGPSGSGKSSLIRAGVVPSLRRAGQDVVVVTPGRDPTAALEPTPSAHPLPVLVVDQLEEVYSLCDDPAARTEFLDRVVTHAQHAPVVLALRADRMGDVSAHRDFAQLVERGLFLLGAMTGDALRAAVVEPARQVGLIVEPGLVDLLVREVEGEPGALPLLSHCLRETWLRREGRTLTVAGYLESGGIRGAVAQSAEELYARIPEGDRGLLRELLLRLVAPGREAEPVRVRMPRRALVVNPAQGPLVDMLIEARLVTSDEGVLGIAHESLARAWPRLRGWLDDDVEGLRIMHHLVAAADAWDGLGRPDSELYRGVRLTQAATWQDTHHLELSSVERDFLAASREAAALEERSAADRARQQTLMIRRLRLSLGGAAVLLVLAMVAGLLAVQQADEANDSARQANEAALRESARRVGAKALITPRLSEALLLAVAGVRLDDSADTRSSLLGVLETNPRLVDSMPLTEGDEVFRVALHPDGRRAATYDAAHHVVLYDLRTGEVLAEHQAGQSRPEWDRQGEMAFSPDGRTLAVTTSLTSPTPVVLLDASTLRPLGAQPQGLPRRPWRATDLSFDRDGSHLAVVAARVGADGTDIAPRPPVVAVWRIDGDRPGSPITLPAEDSVWSIELSSDGREVFLNNPLTRVDLESGDRTRFRVGGFATEGGLELSPDGRLLAAGGGENGGVVVVDAVTGEERHRLGADGNRDLDASIYEPRFTPDGSTLVTVAWVDRVVRSWDMATGQERDEFHLDDGPHSAFAVSIDGTALHAASSVERALRTWSLVHSGLLELVHEGRVVEAAFTDVAPGGRTITLAASLNGFYDERRWFLDTRTGTLLGPLDRPGYSLGGGSWSPDGKSYLSAVGGVIREWDVRTGRVVRRAKPLGDHVAGVDHSPDGAIVAISALDGTVLRLDADSLEPVGEPMVMDVGVPVVSLGPDESTALVLTEDSDPSGVWRDWPTGWAVLDLEGGHVVHQGPTGFLALYAAVSPDGRHGAFSGSNGALAVLDLKTGDFVRPPVTAHDGGIFIFKYSSDGSRILTSGTDGAVVLWDATAGIPLATVRAPGDPFVSADFVDDHTVLISEWIGARAWTWDTRLEPALELACRAAGRDLTEQEWRDHFGDRPYEETCPGTGVS